MTRLGRVQVELTPFQCPHMQTNLWLWHKHASGVPEPQDRSVTLLRSSQALHWRISSHQAQASLVRLESDGDRWVTWCGRHSVGKAGHKADAIAHTYLVAGP